MNLNALYWSWLSADIVAVLDNEINRSEPSKSPFDGYTADQINYFQANGTNLQDISHVLITLLEIQGMAILWLGPLVTRGASRLVFLKQRYKWF